MIEATEVTFYCSGRGKHDRRDLGPAIVQGAANESTRQLAHGFGFSASDLGDLGPDFTAKPSRGRWSREGERVTTRYESVRIEVAKSGNVWHISCPTCKAHKRHKEDFVRQIVERVVNGTDTIVLDVSYWP